jgi:hypothetical protein
LPNRPAQRAYSPFFSPFPHPTLWFRDYVVASALFDCLESLDLHYPEPEQDLSKITIQ